MFALLRVMDAGVGGTRKPQHRIAAGWGSRRQIGIYLSASINIALHGEPSTPDKFSGAAFNK